MRYDDLDKFVGLMLSRMAPDKVVDVIGKALIHTIETEMDKTTIDVEYLAFIYLAKKYVIDEEITNENAEHCYKCCKVMAKLKKREVGKDTPSYSLIFLITTLFSKTSYDRNCKDNVFRWFAEAVFNFLRLNKIDNETFVHYMENEM